MSKDSKLFIDAYTKLEKLLKSESGAKYHESFYTLIDKSSNRVIRHYEKTLKSLSDLRNAIVHSHIDNGDPIAVPHTRTIELLNHIYNEATKPKTVYDLFKKTVQGVTIDNSLKDLLIKINESSFSQFPVYDDNNRIFEIVNTNTIARWLSANLDDSGSLLLIETKVKDLMPSIEYKNNYKFINRDATIYHVYDMFIDSINNNRRNLDAIFITHNGLESEAILGLITIDDFAHKIDATFKINRNRSF